MCSADLKRRLGLAQDNGKYTIPTSNFMGSKRGSNSVTSKMDKVTNNILSESDCEEEIVPPFFSHGWYSLYYTMETAMETTDATNLSRQVASSRLD